MEKITLNLLVPESAKNEEYSVIGDCKELGNWKKSFKLVLSKKQHHFHLSNLKTLDNKINYWTYSFTFKIFRGKSKIHYYYIKKTNSFEI
jgi:hypothetical protein